jgi:hypothetical protein
MTKKTSAPFPLGFFSFPPSHLLPCMYMWSPCACHHPTFLLLNSNRWTYVFPFTLSWPLPFSLCLIFKSTKKHLEQAHILHTNQLKDETNFGLHNLKSCEAPPTPNTTNYYLYVHLIYIKKPIYKIVPYIQSIRFKCPKLLRFKPLSCPKLNCLTFLT